MRSDIAKVIVERPRRGGHVRASRGWRHDVEWRRLREEGREEDSPPRESMRGKWGFNRKEFADFLSPVEGFLLKSVGRPWDDVWSEVSEHLTLASTTQRHVLGHVRDMVHKNLARCEDGVLRDGRGHEPFYPSVRDSILFVSPETGKLEREPRRGRWRRRDDEDTSFGPSRPCIKIAGVWYEASFAEAPVEDEYYVVCGKSLTPGEYFEAMARPAKTNLKRLDFSLARAVRRNAPAWDAVFHEMVRTSSWAKTEDSRHWKSGGTLYCPSKRQLGKREKRRIGLQ